MRVIRLASMSLILFLISAISASVATAAERTIERVAGDVYRVVDDRHRSVFVVTDDGIVVTDPMGAETANWLAKELKKRFNRPVRYVIYSHNHSDHIYGAEVFANSGAIVVAHELVRQDIVMTRAKAVLPQVTFDRHLTLNLGKHQIELRYHGPNDGRGSVSLLVKPEKVLFVVDWIVIGRMPWQKLWSYDIVGMINSTRQALQLDFDTFVGGHAETGDKPAVRRYLTYIEELYAGVIAGIHAGKSLATLKAELKFPKYRDLKQYEQWLPLNIEGVYERLMEESGMSWRPDVMKGK